ncbi:hypothetical protein RB653_001617 [Dictyostelium firmibasis]|uniref:Sulfhydryl oxidase n=1 Tax=Dictyostelium firmibasis TaxID=79012 RepID=A0AAN7U8N6_9MYCE
MKITILILFYLFVEIISGFHTGDLTKKQEIQKASFQFISAAAYRNAQKDREWCEDDKIKGGRPYVWGEYRGMVINYLDLYTALQFDPECDSNVTILRSLFVNQVAQPDPYVVNSTWWDSVFLPTALNAFLCGFNGSKLEDHEFVSDDLLENFDNDKMKQDIWYMIGTYMTSIYKQRENSNRRLDFDAGLYIPFLDKYTGGDYTKTQQMRVGFPTYLGRSLWAVFHIIAQRVSDSSCEGSTLSVYSSLTDKFKNFMVYFPLNHPCPFCREHMISKVLVNDRYAHDQYSSEAIRFFPIEHLLMGGTGGDLIAKLSTIRADDKRSIAAFFWKLHNAVTSSVEQGCQCFTEEIEDTDPYHCEFKSGVLVQSRYPRQQRSYPFAKRFEFILNPKHNYTLFKETRKEFINITTEINKLDTIELRIELYKYWNDSNVKISNDTQIKIDQLMVLINNMTQYFLDTPVLSEAYSFINSTLNCTLTQEYFASLNSSDVEAPNLSIPRTPQRCSNETKPSSCEAQYYVAPVIVEKDNSNESNALPISWLSLILLNIIIFVI